MGKIRNSVELLEAGVYDFSIDSNYDLSPKKCLLIY